MTSRYRIERLFADDRSFQHFVLQMEVPVLCVFANDTDALLDPLFDLLDRSLERLVHEFDIQFIVVLKNFAPEAVERECQGGDCPLIRLYRGGKALLTLLIDLSRLSGDFGSLCNASCRAALEAPWNQPEVDP